MSKTKNTATTAGTPAYREACALEAAGAGARVTVRGEALFTAYRALARRGLVRLERLPHGSAVYILPAGIAALEARA